MFPMSSHSDISTGSKRRLSSCGLRCAGLSWIVITGIALSALHAQSLYTVTAPPADGTSSGLRVPNGVKEHAYHRAVVFISAHELASVPAGITITHLGFVLAEGAGTPVSGTLTLFMANTASTVSDSRAKWTEVVSGMTTVYSGSFTVPDTAGSLDVKLLWPFMHNGQSLYVAYEFQSPGPYTTSNAVYASNTAIPSSVRSAFSVSEPPVVLNDVSAFRPVLRFSFPIPSIRWSKVAIGTEQNIAALDVADDNTAWICASSGGVYRTTDRGSTWLNAGGPANSASSVLGLTKATAVVVTATDSTGNTIFKTTDGGVKWTEVYQTGPSAPVSVVGKTSSRDLWAIIGPVNAALLILSSGDQGSTWTQLAGGVAVPEGVRAARGSSYRIDNVVWFGVSGPIGVGDRVYRSANGPSGPWTFSSTGRVNTATLAFSSIGRVGFAGHAGCADTISKTGDGGLTWTSVVVPGMGEVRSLECFPGGKDFWAVTSSGIWYTGDGGITWTQSFSCAASVGSLSAIRFFANFQNSLAVGARGLIMRGAWSLPALVGIAKQDGALMRFSLESNYPNPFNSSTRIEFTLPRPCHVSMILFDLLGREVATIISGPKNSGRHEVEWVANGQASGVYFYRLQACGFVQTKKLILLQ